jgi:hypothetical protein
MLKMKVEQFTKYQITPFTKALKSDYMIYAIERPATSLEEMEKLVSGLGTLCEKIHNRLIKTKQRADTDAFKIHNKMPNECYSFTSLFPHLRPGYSPFVFHREAGQIRGVMICFGEETRSFCEKTIEKYAGMYFESENLKDSDISLQAARSEVRDVVFAGKNKIGDIEMYVPLITKRNVRHIYLDLEKHYALLKTGVKQNQAIQEVLELIRRTYKTLDKEKTLGSSDLFEDIFSERFYITHYTRQAISKGETTQPYHLTELVSFYAKNQKPSSDGVTPLMTANFVSTEDSTNEIRFKNTVTMILSPEEATALQEETPFTVLQHVSRSKNMDIRSLLMTGEVTKTSQLKQYSEKFPEDEDPNLKLSHQKITYQTQSKEGNIRFAIKSGIDLHIHCFNALIREEMHDRHFSLVDREKLFLEHMGGLLPLLHDTTELFVSLYHGAFDIENADDKFDSDNESPLDAALKQA